MNSSNLRCLLTSSHVNLPFKASICSGFVSKLKEHNSDVLF